MNNPDKCSLLIPTHRVWGTEHPKPVLNLAAFIAQPPEYRQVVTRWHLTSGPMARSGDRAKSYKRSVVAAMLDVYLAELALVTTRRSAP